MQKEPFILDITEKPENHSDKNNGFSFIKEHRWNNKDKDFTAYLEDISEKLEIIVHLLTEKNGKE